MFNTPIEVQSFRQKSSIAVLIYTYRVQSYRECYKPILIANCNLDVFNNYFKLLSFKPIILELQDNAALITVHKWKGQPRCLLLHIRKVVQD